MDLLLGWAREDGRLLAHLTLLAAEQSDAEPDLSAFRRAIDEAVDAYGFVSYREVPGYAEGIGEAVDDIERLLGAGHPRAAIELCERALAGVEGAMDHIDDSDGYMGGILQRLQDLHLDACGAARPDPESLAVRLFQWEMSSDWGTFWNAAVRYADILGDQGRAVYRRLAEARWADVPPRGPGDDRAGTYGERSRITHIMENLAELDDDLDALVEVKSRDLSTAHAHLAIAELLRERGEPDRALEWAERGVAAFPERTDGRLRTFLAEEYARRSQGDRAAELLWANFVDRPALPTYEELHALTSPAGTWPAWRTRALAVLTGEARAPKDGRAAAPTWTRRDGSELVRVYLWEKDPEAAWSGAGELDCSQELWMELAQGREAEHPGDAIAVYMRFVEPAIAQRNNRAYEQAVALLRRIAVLMDRTAQGTAFLQYVAGVRAAHKPKRNLMKLLDKERWP